MKSKLVTGAAAVGAFILAQSFVGSVIADGMLTITAAAVGFGVGWLSKK